MKRVTQNTFNFLIAVFVIGAVAIAGYFIVHQSQAAGADINADGKINATDLSIMAANYGKSGQTFAQGDITGDGLVNIFDLSVLASNWGGTTAGCTGVAMTNGQSDIIAHAAGTTYCITGTHNWTLTPKTGDQLIASGTAILDGANTTQYAVIGNASNVTVSGLEIRNYTTANQQGAISATGSGWTLRNLQVHDNGTTCSTAASGNYCSSGAGGHGSTLGNAWNITGGRYYNNRQNGLGGGGTGTVLDGVEVDHNNFATDAYTIPNMNCDFEAGGIKWVTNNLTIKNSSVHDNACRGIWSDIGATGITLSNNNVYNNWDSGIFIEESGSANITGNTVSNNGFKVAYQSFNGCVWGLGGGITISSSGHTHTTPNGLIDISGNDVESNCSALTGIDQNRIDGLLNACIPTDRCMLAHLRIHDNKFVGTSNPLAKNYIGYFTDVPGEDLRTHDIIYGTGNTISGPINNCQFSC